MPTDERGEARGDIEVDSSEQHLPTLVARTCGTSLSEARRLIATGAVRLNGRVVPSDKIEVSLAEGTSSLSVGKRRVFGIRFLPDARHYEYGLFSPNQTGKLELRAESGIHPSIEAMRAELERRFGPYAEEYLSPEGKGGWKVSRRLCAGPWEPASEEPPHAH